MGCLIALFVVRIYKKRLAAEQNKFRLLAGVSGTPLRCLSSRDLSPESLRARLAAAATPECGGARRRSHGEARGAVRLGYMSVVTSARSLPAS